MTTIYDVARMAGVSPATVSRVHNGARVAPDFAERVMAASTALGYRPNRVARSLRRQSSDVIGLVISDIENPFFTSLARGVEDEIQSVGRSVVLCNTDENLAKEQRYIQVMLDENIAGVIIAAASADKSDVARLIERGIPVVAIDRRPHHFDVDAVLVDNEHGAAVAVRHLIAQGYRRIGCVTGPEDATTSQSRVRGYVEAMTAAGRADQLLIRHTDFKVDGGYEGASDLLSRDEVDALFTTNNLMAVGALQALRDHGRTMPETGFVTFDEMPWAALISPTLSTVRQPAYDIGREAARVLNARIEQPDRPIQTVTLLTTFLERESSRRITGLPIPVAPRTPTRRTRKAESAS